MSHRRSFSRPVTESVPGDTLNEDALWDTAEQLTRIGTWDWSPDTGELYWSENLFRLMGYEPWELVPTPKRVFERIHPADVERVGAELEAARLGGPLPPIAYRIVLPDGSVRHLESTAAVDRHGSGSLRRLVAFVRDVTDQRCAERELAVRRAAAGALAAWDSFEPGARRLLGALGESLSVTAGALWTPRGELLSPSVLWGAPTVDVEAVRRAFCAQRPPRGVGLAGQAWERGRPVASTTSHPAGAPLEGDITALDGMRPTVAFPAAAPHGAVLSVLALYSTEPLESGERLMAALADVGRQLGTLLARRRSGPLEPPRLTARELEVLGLAAAGLGGTDIEARLHVSRSTVKSHFENIYKKLGVSSRVAAVACAMREGLIE